MAIQEMNKTVGKLSNQKGYSTLSKMEFYIDSANDIATLPNAQECLAGSKAIDTSTGDIYIMNTEGGWNKVFSRTSGGSEGGSTQPQHFFIDVIAAAVEGDTGYTFELENGVTLSAIKNKILTGFDPICRVDFDGIYQYMSSSYRIDNTNNQIVFYFFTTDNDPITSIAGIEYLIISEENSVTSSIMSFISIMKAVDPTGIGSFSLNRKENTTIGQYSFAAGDRVTASGFNAHAEGSQNIAEGSSSHAEGSQTTASGICSHAEGNQSTASGYISHVEGKGNVASGIYSHAEGYRTVANSKSQHVFGEFNIPDVPGNEQKGSYIEIVGNGTTENSLSNARTLDWQGNEILKGTLTTTGLTIGQTSLTEVQLQQLLTLLNN